MNTMSIPGFTAEMALLPATKPYFRSSTETSAHGMIIAQASKLRGPTDDEIYDMCRHNGGGRVRCAVQAYILHYI